MQRHKVLNDKLKFTAWFLELSTASFREIKRKITVGEHPYESGTRSEEDSEPPFAIEWLNADQAIQLQGQLCLNLVQRSLCEYLEQTVKLSPRKPPSKKGHWFENYKRWFLEEGIDLSGSGADLLLIEELTLARNRIQHGSASVVR